MQSVDIVSYGFDIVHARYVFAKPLPTTDEAFRTAMTKLGWKATMRPELGESGEPVLHTQYLLQVNGLAYRITGAGHKVTVAFPAPRYFGRSMLNFNLATASEVRTAVEDAAQELRERLPATYTPTLEVECLSRMDVAVDIDAQDAKQTLIKAAEQFRIPNVKKQSKVKRNDESTTVKSPSATFRVYDQAAEASKKTKRLELSGDERTFLEAAKRSGRVRMVFTYKKRGGYALEALESLFVSYADTLEKGFAGGVFQVEDIEGMMLKLESLDINEMTRAKLYAFFVRYAFLGLEGTRDQMGRTAYFDVRKKIREYDLVEGDLDQNDLSEFEEEFSLQFVFEALRASAP